MLRLLSLLAALCLLAGAALAAAPARGQETETEIVCGDEEEPEPALDEDGFIAEPDESTDADRAGDYDDSAEDQTIPEDEGDELTPEERAAMGRCLSDAATATFRDVVKALREGRPTPLPQVGPAQLPYGGKADLTLRRRSGGRLLGRAKLNVRSGDERRLRLRLTPAGRRALRGRHRLRVLARLKLTDKLSGRSEARGARVVLLRR